MNATVLFLILAFGISWSIAGIYYLLGGELYSGPGLVMAICYMFGPATAAVIVQRWIVREPIARPLGITFRVNGWWAVAWLLPLAVALLAFAVALLFPGVAYAPGFAGMFERYGATLSPEQLAEMRRQLEVMPFPLLVLFILLQTLFAGLTVNAVAAFGEELGWRGFLARRLGQQSFWKAAAVIGVAWGVWHAPLIIQGYNYPRHPVAGVGMMVLLTLLLSPILLYLRLRAGSVIAAAIFHGSFNASAGLALIFLRGGNDLIVGLTGVAGLLAYALANVGLYLYDRHSSAPIMGRAVESLLPAPETEAE